MYVHISVITMNREKLRLCNVLAGICRKLDCQLWLTLAMKVSGFIQSFAFPRSTACSRYSCVRRLGEISQLFDEQTCHLMRSLVGSNLLSINVILICKLEKCLTEENPNKS